MKVIGITGGVGCGKSAVLDLIKENFNAHIIKADDVGKTVLDKGTKGYKQVVELFGDDILDSNEEINRKKLADIVFNNPNKLMVLNSIVHPQVKKIIVEKIAYCKCYENFDYFFVEAALLFEDHYENFCDETWYIYSDIEQRKERLISGRGYTLEKINSILNNQMSEDEFKDRCDKVIDNSYSLESTLLQLKNMLS